MSGEALGTGADEDYRFAMRLRAQTTLGISSSSGATVADTYCRYRGIGVDNPYLDARTKREVKHARLHAATFEKGRACDPDMYDLYNATANGTDTGGHWLSPLIYEGEALPTAHTAPFIPVRDKQATLLLKVYEGSCFEIANCFWRAEATISLPTDVVSRFDVTCEVTFALGIDGALEMSAASSKKSGGGVYDSKKLETSLRSSALSRVDLLVMSARLGYASLFERLVVHWRQGTLVRRAATAAALLLGAAWLARGFARRNTN